MSDNVKKTKKFGLFSLFKPIENKRTRLIIYLSIIPFSILLALVIVALMPKQCLVRYMDVNFDDLYTMQGVCEGEKVTELPTIDYDEHLIFEGWYWDKEYTNEFDIDTKIVEDITLYPKYRYEYKVTFMDADGQNIYLEQIYGANDPVYEPNGFDYDTERLELFAWYRDSEFTRIFHFENTIREDITLYPRFKNKYKITFMSADLESVYETRYYLEDQNVYAISGPSSDGGSFISWYMDSECTVPFVFGSPINDCYTLYPLFDK